MPASATRFSIFLRINCARLQRLLRRARGLAAQARVVVQQAVMPQAVVGKTRGIGTIGTMIEIEIGPFVEMQFFPIRERHFIETPGISQ